MSNPLSGLKIDHWWHAFTVLGAAGIIASMTIKSNVVSNRDALLLSLGFFLFGVGQWINHPLQTRLEGSLKFTGYHRSPYPLGLVLEFLGCIIFAIEIFRIAFTK